MRMMIKMSMIVCNFVSVFFIFILCASLSLKEKIKEYELEFFCQQCTRSAGVGSNVSKLVCITKMAQMGLTSFWLLVLLE